MILIMFVNQLECHLGDKNTWKNKIMFKNNSNQQSCEHLKIKMH